MNAMKKKKDLPTHRAHVYYTGRVQGVGFRYTAEAVAHRVGVHGFVKNLPDGRVEMVCESNKKKIETVLEEIQKGSLGQHITHVDCSWEDPSGEFEDFRVEFQY
jgi:acylphosphatase